MIIEYFSSICWFYVSYLEKHLGSLWLIWKLPCLLIIELSILYSLDKSPLSNIICKNIISLYGLSFHFLHSVLWRTKVVTFLKSILSIFPFVAWAFSVKCKKPLPNPTPWNFMVVSSKNFIVLAPTFWVFRCPPTVLVNCFFMKANYSFSPHVRVLPFRSTGQRQTSMELSPQKFFPFQDPFAFLYHLSISRAVITFVQICMCLLSRFSHSRPRELQPQGDMEGSCSVRPQTLLCGIVAVLNGEALFSFCVCAGAQTQGLSLARQVL